MSTQNTNSRPLAINMASDVLVQAMQLIAPAGKSADTSARRPTLSLASDALLHASRLIARFGAGKLASSRGKDIAGVRAMASRVQSTDHRLASDLLAAADRHERESETLR